MKLSMNSYNIHSKKHKMKNNQNKINILVNDYKQKNADFSQEKKVILLVNSNLFYFDKMDDFFDFFQSTNYLQDNIFFKNLHIFDNCFVILCNTVELLDFKFSNFLFSSIQQNYYKKYLNHQSLRIRRNMKAKNIISNEQISSLVQIFKCFEKSLKTKITLNNKEPISLNKTKVAEITFNENQKCQINQKSHKNNQKSKLFSNKVEVFIKFDDQFDFNYRLRKQLLFIETIRIDSIENLNLQNINKICFSVKKALIHFRLYELIASKERRLMKNELISLYRNITKIISQIYKEKNSKYIEKIYFENDEFKQLLLEVNYFVLRHSSLKSNLQKNWISLSTKFSKINRKISKDDQSYQLIIQSFQNIKKYNHSKSRFNNEQKKSLTINLNSIFESIQIFFNFISNDQTKKQSQKIEKKLFNVIFHPLTDDSLRTNIFSVYQMHDNLINSNESIYSLTSSTGSGKTRCIPFFLSIKTIQDDMKRPFFIMTQPRYSIIKTKIDDFKSIFDDSIRIVTNIKKMMSFYKRYDRKDVNFHPKFSKPIFGLFTAQSLLELIKMAEKDEIDIFSMTRFCLDEIHERTIETDVLCAVLTSKINEMIKQNKNFDLQLLLMSATPDSRVFNCFDKITKFNVPESNLFPIETIKHEAEKENRINSIIVNQTIQTINKMANCELEQGHILIFTSGNSRMNGIQRNLVDKIERKCTSKICAVKVIDDFDSLFEDEDVDLFYSKLDTFIEQETNKFNFFKSKGQSLLFVLPIKYLGYVTKEQKEICINPIPKHSNVIKVIIATNAIESSITIDNLAVVIDSGLYNKFSFNRENGLTNLNEEQISIQNQIQRKGRVGRLRSGVSVKIELKNKKMPELLPPAIQISDVSLNILSLRKIGYRIEEIENLPDKIDESEKEKYISELVSFGALTDDTHDLTPLGSILIKFGIISPFISAAILSIAEFKVEDFDKNEEEITQKELFVLLGCLISLIFNSGDIVVNLYAEKLREFFDKRSDIITLLRTILDLTQFEKKEIRLKEEEYGLNGRLVIKLLGQLQQIAENLFLSKPKEEEKEGEEKLNSIQRETKKKEEETKKSLFWKTTLKSLRELLDNLMSDDFLIVFIEMFLEQIGQNKPEWLNSRRVEFNDIESASTEPVFIFTGDKSLSFSSKENISYIGLMNRPGLIGLDCPPNGFILSIMHDNNTKLNYGYLIHSCYTDERCEYIPHPISIETSNQLNNNFTTTLLDAYFARNNDHFNIFHSNDDTILFAKSNEVIQDSNNKDCILISFIPRDEDAIKVLKDAIEVIESLLPYTASNILIPNKELKCVVSLHGEGKDRIDSSVHFFDDEDFYPYELNKETINYLHDNIEVLKLRNETMKISITGDSFYYNFERNNNNSNEPEKSSSRIESPSAIPKNAAVFSNKNTSKPLLIMTSTLKIDEFCEKGYLIPWINEEEMIFVSKNEQEMVNTANTIAKETITFKLSFYRLIFMTSESILQRKGKVPSSYGDYSIPHGLGELQKIFYLCAKNYIQGDSLTSPLEFRGFYYRGKPFKQIDEVYQIPQTQFRYLGNSVIALDVRNEFDVDNIIEEMFQICRNNDVHAGVEMIPVYSVNIKHSINSNHSKEEFTKRVDSVIDQFGGIIAWKSQYIDITSKLTGYQGIIKVLLYCVDFAIPLAGMIKKVLEETKIDPFVDVFNNTIDQVLFYDRKVQEVLTNWFIENDLEYDQDHLQLIGDEEKINHALLKFKQNPPQMPFKSYPVPERLNILQVNAHLNHLNKKFINKWYLNKLTRTLYAPIFVDESKVLEFLKQFENETLKNKKIEDEEILWELDLHDEDDGNLETFLSRQMITIFNDNNEIVQKNYCVECLYSTFLYNLRKMYNKEEDCCSIMEIYDDDKLLQNISFIDKDSTQRIPFGQMMWAFIKEPRIKNMTRTYITALAVRGLKKSKKITFCPLHSYILLPSKCGISVNCSIPTCNFYMCIDCHQWHQIGKCEKEPSLPAGSRICPFCNESVEKMVACNHIHCKCGKDFCYYCGQGFENSNECYSHMDKEKHWEEAPDYIRFVQRKPVKNKELKEFYEKYPKWKPKWMEDEDSSDNEAFDD